MEKNPPLTTYRTHFVPYSTGYVQWIKRMEALPAHGEKGDYFLTNDPHAFRADINAPLAKDYYSNHLSFFCRKELQIEKATSVPLRFRLGSVQYTDYLEKKPNAVWNR